MDWVSFLDTNNIPYVTRGPNTKRGEVSIKCPFCGEDDPSQHLGINVNADKWGCLRDPTHRGLAPHRLIAALIGCSTPQAKLVVAQYSRADPGSVDEALAMLTGTSEAPKVNNGPLALPPEFRPIRQHGPLGKFYRYLLRRGFDDVDRLVQNYDLRGALTGRWHDRLIIPLYRERQVIGWTGRALQDNPINAPRYDSHGDVKGTIFNEDVLLSRGGDTLFIVEGPFDALKLDYYGRPHKVRGTCLFGTSFSLSQIQLVRRLLSQRFKRGVLLFDQDATGQMFNAVDWFAARNLSIGRLPETVKDPGKLTKDGILDLIELNRNTEISAT